MIYNKVVALSLLLFSIIAQSSFGIDLSQRQWNIKNTGQSYIRKTSELGFENIDGIKGIDINYFNKNQLDQFSSNKVVVAVIDTGVDVNHPEIKENIWYYPGCIGKSEEEKKALPCQGYNVLDGNGNVSDEIGHGTFVAGLLAGKKDNVGIDGLLPESIEIMPIKAITNFRGFTHDGKVVSSYLAKAIAFAVNNGAQVLNLSLGIPKVIETPQVVSAIDYALKKNVIVVASAGNNNKRRNIFPCNYNGVVCVGGIDIQGQKVSSSNYGQTVDIYAPGEKLVGTIPSNMESTVLRVGNYDVKTGTSFSIAHITALAAAAKVKDLGINSYNFLARLKSYSRTLSESGLLVADYQKFINSFDDSSNKSLPPVFLTKEIDSITIDKLAAKSFGATLGFDIYSEYELEDANICLSSIVINSGRTCRQISLKEGLNRVQLSSVIPNLDIDTWQGLKLSLQKDENLISEKSFDAQFFVPLPISSKKQVSKIAAGALLRIAPNIKSSQLQKVIEFDANKSTQDYFVLNNRSLKSIFYLSEEANNFRPFQVNFSKDIKVISVMKVDMNLDGQLDILVYGTSSNNREYILESFDSQGRPLFGEYSRWSLNATQFGGLDFNRGRPYFNFIKTQTTKLGTILVPLVSKIFELPQVDNNTDPVDFLNNIQKKRPYYLLPSLQDDEVKLEIRTLESYQFDSKIRDILDLPFFKKLQFVSFLEQDKESQNSGQVRIIYALGEVSFNEYYEIIFNDTHHFEIVKKGRSLQIHQSNIATVRSTIDGDFISEYLITRQQELNKLSFKLSSGRRTLKFESDWNDPLASILAVYKEEQYYSIYIEGRYHIHLVVTDGKNIISSSKTAINRESSFPGGNFSQIFQMGQLSSSKGAIYTDMQRLFGDNIRLITSHDNKLSKKLKYNYAIPSQCALIGHTQIEKQMQVRLHCLGPGKFSSIMISNIMTKK
ncbi:peptidase, S8/S53 family [Bacteriovorax sp. BAL6_X]|uniref:S8 family peptidase n=1 Tax=Bacteriovorax sp. BAL6_X TaxID=1201290 RepID=UPI0003863AC6|nr:S8 family serine peptidase [Bacteriovorax sp. BAL6_X]EPZ50857.1 peptidase, S8/S53 family [Bacteriovorax sp. BAL6_X]